MRRSELIETVQKYVQGILAEIWLKNGKKENDDRDLRDLEERSQLDNGHEIA